MENQEKLNLDEFLLDEIESIEIVGDVDTIDISVEDTHMFYANDIYTHNSSLQTEVVDTHQMGGSIRKAQIGHFILSIARSKEQKEVDKATLAILKSRFGRDGIVFPDSIYNNKTLEIVIKEAGVTNLELDKSTTMADQQRTNNDIMKAFAAIREKKAEGLIITEDK
jgi:hypothetical protein